MLILTFGSEKRSNQLSEMVKVSMKTREGPDRSLELFAVPQICEPLSCQPISEKFDHLLQLKLANFLDGETPMGVDVLIGSDCYWELRCFQRSQWSSCRTYQIGIGAARSSP